jgi:hypothetical protein
MEAHGTFNTAAENTFHAAKFKVKLEAAHQKAAVPPLNAQIKKDPPFAQRVFD